VNLIQKARFLQPSKLRCYLCELGLIDLNLPRGGRHLIENTRILKSLEFRGDPGKLGAIELDLPGGTRDLFKILADNRIIRDR